MYDSYCIVLFSTCTTLGLIILFFSHIYQRGVTNKVDFNRIGALVKISSTLLVHYRCKTRIIPRCGLSLPEFFPLDVEVNFKHCVYTH